MEDALRVIRSAWVKMVASAVKAKSSWQEDADECMRFFSGPYTFMYGVDDTAKGTFLYTGTRKMPQPSICMVARTPVRMANGTEKPIEDVAIGDEVTTHTGAKRKVLKTFKRLYDGNLVTITLNGFPFPLTMTADHRMAVWNGERINWVPAKDINEKDAMLVGWDKSNPKEHVLDMAKILGPESILLDELMAPGAFYGATDKVSSLICRTKKSIKASGVDWKGKVKLPHTHIKSAVYRSVAVTASLARLLGLYLAEGCASPCGVTFVFGPKQEHYAREVQTLVRGIFGVFGRVFHAKNEHNGTWRIVFANRNLVDIFRSLCPGHAATKRVPGFIFGCSEEIKLALYTGWMHGDGHMSCKVTKNRHALQMFGVTVSPGMARDMTVLALSCGLRAKTYLLKSYRGASDRYTVTVSGKKAVSLFPVVMRQAEAVLHDFKPISSEFTNFGCIRKVKEISEAQVSGVYVYDFEVEEDHSFLAGNVTSSNCMTVNKLAEAVQLFGPALYHQNPVRTVTPRKIPELPQEIFGDPNDPRSQAMLQGMLMQTNSQGATDKARSAMLSTLLNYMPIATNLKLEMRATIDEAIIKGMSVQWHDVYTPVGSQHKLIGSFNDNVDNLLLDPDAKRWDDIKWVGKICVKPVWEVEAEYGLPGGSLKANKKSNTQDAMLSSLDNRHRHREGKTNDLLVYYKIWSKMGMGSLLRDANSEASAHADQFGQYVQLVVCETAEFPLNLPPTIWNNPEEMYRRAQWETPYWAEGGWPFEELAFHRSPETIWPMAHFTPGMGELKFINWAFSFLISKVAKNSRDFLAMQSGLDADIKTALIDSPLDFNVLEFKGSHAKNIGELVQFLQHPEMNGDLFKVIQAVMDMFEKRVGLTELMYGSSSHQYRSAAEADVKQNATSIRPDDMANLVEDFAGAIAKKEAMAARWHMTGRDISSIFGPAYGPVWDQLVASADFNAIARQLDYRIESGSAKKPNKQKDIDDANQALSVLFPFYSQLAMSTGQVNPLNNLVTQWGKAFDYDTSGLMIQPPPPPPPPAQGPQ